MTMTDTELPEPTIVPDVPLPVLSSEVRARTKAALGWNEPNYSSIPAQQPDDWQALAEARRELAARNQAEVTRLNALVDRLRATIGAMHTEAQFEWNVRLGLYAQDRLRAAELDSQDEEIERLRDLLTERDQEISILQGELATARNMAVEYV
jgi:predicted RNase H-like nuclease (RuvC/YqgF family)